MPSPVVTDDQLAWSTGQIAHQLAAVEDVGIVDGERPRTKPRSGCGERHHHIGFGPSFVGEIGEAGKIDHLGAIATDDSDLVPSPTPERRDLALDQWLA